MKEDTKTKRRKHFFETGIGIYLMNSTVPRLKTPYLSHSLLFIQMDPRGNAVLLSHVIYTIHVQMNIFEQGIPI
ncbi:hypothetical protein L2E82_52689 [Cichorium intybus]|nr:hypothetical protein L2E82_52689 [Cichorium intybus]